MLANNFDIFLLPWSMGRDNIAHNHRFLIAQTQKQQVTALEEDVCNQNGNYFTPPFPMPYHKKTALHAPVYYYSLLKHLP